MYWMIHPLLTAIFLGLFPAGGMSIGELPALAQVSIAPPVHPFVVEEPLSASGVLVVDLETGQNVFSLNARGQRPVASLTKLMTAILIVENHDLSEIVTVPANAENVAGNRVYLSAGKKYYLGGLLSALLINSANDAAITLAQYHSGSVQDFVAEMNKRALQLGLKGTSFTNPIGLDNPSHWSTPQDIAWLTTYALGKPEIAVRMSKSGDVVASLDGAETLRLYHTHMLMHAQPDADQPEIIAGKTGTTGDAGECLVSVVQEHGRKYLVVLLGSAQRYKDMDVILRSMNAAHSSQAVSAGKPHESLASQ